MRLILDAGHCEYDVRKVAGLTTTHIWPLNDEDDERYEWDEEKAREEFLRRTGTPTELAPDADYSWSHIVVWEGDLGAIVSGLAELVGEIDTDLGGDDDTFDYWPSGVRYALQVAHAVGPYATAEVESTARRIITEQRSAYADELADKVGISLQA